MLPFDVQYNRSEYKKDTKYIAGYLLKASRKCGYRPRNSTSLKGYDIHEDDFEPMARCIAKNASRAAVPAFLRTIFVRAIRYRREVAIWYRTQSLDQRADEQHDAFASRLERTLNILRPHMPKARETERPKNTSKTTTFDQDFSKLKVHDTNQDHQEDIEPQAILENLPSVPSVEIGTDDSNVEENFFIETKSLLKELQNLRGVIVDMWIEKETDLITKALVTNTAIDLVRRKEYEFDQTIVRPSSYPADKFPTWCLPALLLYRDIDPNRLRGPLDMEQFVKPSHMIIGARVHNRQNAGFWFYSVYNGLKLFVAELDLAMPGEGAKSNVLCYDLQPIRDNSVAVDDDFFAALEWAHCLYLVNDIHEGKLPEDGVSRGILHLCEEREVPLWVTVGMQILVDLKGCLNDTISDAFRELQRDLVETSIRIEMLRKHQNPLVAPYKDTALGWLSDTLVPLLKSYILGDRLVTDVRRRQEKNSAEHLAWMEKQTNALLKEKHYFWRHHPLKCGLVKYFLGQRVREDALVAEQRYDHILSVAHLYNICRNLFPDSPRFPDMEFYIERQDPKYLFFDRPPQTLVEAQDTFLLAQCGVTSVTMWNRKFKPSKKSQRTKYRRAIRNPCLYDEFTADRLTVGRAHVTIAKADTTVGRFLNAITDNKHAIQRLRLFNLPAEVVNGNEEECAKMFNWVPRTQLEPLKTLGWLQVWIELEYININFDLLGLLKLCSEILYDIFDIYRDEFYREAFGYVKGFEEGRATEKLYASTTILKIISVPSQVSERREPGIRDTHQERIEELRKIYDIMQKHYRRLVNDTPGARTWAGDACIAKLVTTEKEKRPGHWWSPVSFFDGRGIMRTPDKAVEEEHDILQGPAAASKLYMNWDFEGKREESKMFNAISRFRKGLERRQWESACEEREKAYQIAKEQDKPKSSKSSKSSK